MVERRLGRGLEFFLSDSAKPATGEGEEVVNLELQQLEANPHQPRQHFDPQELQELADSLRCSGILQPILVRAEGKRYQIVAGERRWRAAKLAGLERVPALVRDITDEMAAVYGLVENIQRAELNAIEKAKAFQKIQALTQGSQAEVAQQVGLERSSPSATSSGFWIFPRTFKSMFHVEHSPWAMLVRFWPWPMLKSKPL